LRYKKANRNEKTAILDEFCATCGYHRKHAIRVLKGFKRFTKPKQKKRGNPSKPHTVMLGHLSYQRNNEELALNEMGSVFREREIDLNFKLFAAPLYECSAVVNV
jgi:hypothetical protein